MFLKLGVIGFGGPAAHVALMRREVVEKRRWLDEQQFLDLLGATNLIPGPNSTEMAIHLGYRRAGWPGLIVGGAGFIAPAMLIVLGLSWAYVTYGSTPAAGWLLFGLKPVILAIVGDAIWKLGRRAVRSPLTAAAALGVLAGFFLGADAALLLFGASLAVMLIAGARRRRRDGGTGRLAALGLPAALIPSAAAAGTAPFSVGVLFLTSLKIGAVLYGSGYTLMAFLQRDFVDRLGWLTQEQLIDAIAIGQVTPGPVFTAMTFIGYVLGEQAGGTDGAGVIAGLAATLGIFLPSFVLVGLSHPLIPRLRASDRAGSFLDGANAASVALMAAVTLELGRAALSGPPAAAIITAALTLAALIALLRFEVSSLWLVSVGAAAGLAAGLLGLAG